MKSVYILAVFATACLFHAASAVAGISAGAGGMVLLPEQFSVVVGQKNITSQVVQEKMIRLRTTDRLMDIQLYGISANDSCIYRMVSYDDNWLPFQNGLMRLGEFPEGDYYLLVLTKKSDKVICNIPVQVKGGLFYGFRGYLIVFTFLGMGIVIFFWIRSFFLKKDKNRTVKYLENTVMRRTTQLQQVINQRELLLKEIHHRVKNNLQVISALLEMQAARTTDENVKAAIKEGQNRVLSIAFIHQNLYQHDDLKGVEINSFLRELTSHIRQVFERPGCPVEVVNEVPKFYLDIDSAIPLGLLINELLTNAYKYAFAGKNSGMIRIKIEDLGEGSYSFCFIDDGVGLPNDFDFTRSNTLGMKLIRQLSRQLAGNIYYKYDGGCKFELTFKNLNARSKML
jgi:two-component sensor histidine kinase